MKKRIFYGGIVSVLLIFCVLIGFLMADNFKGKDYIGDSTFQDEPNYIKGYAGQRNLVDTYETNGIISQSNYDLSKIVIDKTNVVELKVKKGQEFKEKDILYVENQLNILATCSGKIIDIMDTLSSYEVLFLDYSKQFVSTLIDYEQYSKINYDTIVSYQDVEGEKTATITYIDYKIENKKVNVLLKLNQGYLLGTPITLQFIKGIRDNVMTIPLSFAVFSENKVYVFVKSEDGKYSRKYFKPGLITSTYVEVIDHAFTQGEEIYVLSD